MTGLKVKEVNVNIQGVHAITEKNEDSKGPEGSGGDAQECGCPADNQ